MKSLYAAAFALCLATPAFAGTTTLDFEGVTSFASIADYYNGGADSEGATGPAWGISFGGDALGLANDQPDFPFFSHAPSPVGIMAPVGAESTMNVASGFAHAISFFYTASSSMLGGVQVWSGLDGGGSLLASFDLLGNAQSGCDDSPFCHFDQLSGAFDGIAHSVTFGNAANIAGFDNVSITAVPEPTTMALMALGLGAIGFARRRRA